MARYSQRLTSVQLAPVSPNPVPRQAIGASRHVAPADWRFLQVEWPLTDVWQEFLDGVTPDIAAEFAVKLRYGAVVVKPGRMPVCHPKGGRSHREDVSRPRAPAERHPRSRRATGVLLRKSLNADSAHRNPCRHGAPDASIGYSRFNPARATFRRSVVSNLPGSGADRDSAVTADLDTLIGSGAEQSEAFAASAADTRMRLELLQAFARVRRRKKMNQTEIARLMSTTQSAISELEKGVVEPRLSTLQRYARILGHRLRLTLVEEPKPSYNDREMRYQPRIAALKRPDSPTERIDGAPLADPMVSQLDNVTYVEFRPSKGARLTGSLATRIRATETA
jgi:transcriptional regulator with XRE-family HTH domain